MALAPLFQPRAPSAATLPRRAGLGLKAAHVAEVLASLPPVGFFEVHAENYMVDGGPLHHQLGRIRAHYPLSLHGVGLSIGGESPLDEAHLDRLAALIDRYQPAVFSEHLAWSGHGGIFLNDLLPLPWTRATLQRVCAHVDRVQSRLKRTLLLENPATYVEFTASTYSEAQFMAEVLQRTGCGLLLDLNNLHVSCVNHARKAEAYLDALPLDRVMQLHLAGFELDQDAAGAPLLIDHHGAPVDDAVWRLLADLLARTGPLPTLIERDNNVPPLADLLGELRRADAYISSVGRPRSAAGGGR